MWFVIKLCVIPLLLILVLFYLGRFFLYRTALIHAVRKLTEWVDDRIHVHQEFRVPEFNDNGQPNMLYRKVSLYVNSLPSLEDSDYTNLFSGKKSNDILLYMDDRQIVRDCFLAAAVTWTISTSSSGAGDHVKTFLFRIKKKDKRRILKPYLQHIHTVADEIERRTKEIRLFFMNGGGAMAGMGRWRSTPFTHPSTFETLVMDPDLKARVKSDLDTFLKSEQYYHKLGRVWKRSYLLYGPSGTGKSSFIAAMANHMKYDVYDVDLSRISGDSYLNMLLLQIAPKSIVVVEDLDVLALNSAVTPSGLLNFMDGIANSCSGDEKIMVFTVNKDRKDDVEAAMLRPGRVDLHIHFPLCNFNSFKSLASNYLGLKEHKLFPQVEEMFQSGATMSPAEIGELMLVNRSSPSRAIKSVITALQSSGASKNTRRSSAGTSSSPSPPAEEHGGAGAWKDSPTVKEVRKLYGLLRLKSNVKKSGPLDLDSGLIER